MAARPAPEAGGSDDRRLATAPESRGAGPPCPPGCSGGRPPPTRTRPAPPGEQVSARRRHDLRAQELGPEPRSPSSPGRWPGVCARCPVQPHPPDPHPPAAGPPQPAARLLAGAPAPASVPHRAPQCRADLLPLTPLPPPPLLHFGFSWLLWGDAEVPLGSGGEGSQFDDECFSSAKPWDSGWSMSPG